jgi:hypothetical protein
LAEIIDLLRAKTAHDFALYKPGTLLRRIERRMALAAVPDIGRYIDMVQQDAGELDLLAKDLLINVTGFFRDPKGRIGHPGIDQQAPFAAGTIGVKKRLGIGIGLDRGESPAASRSSRQWPATTNDLCGRR